MDRPDDLSHSPLRSAIAAKVAEVVQCFAPDASIYGSFSDDTFHLIEEKMISLSDLDLILRASPRLALSPSEISQRVLAAANIKITVSIRHGHPFSRPIPMDLYILVSYIEYLNKLRAADKNIELVSLAKNYAAIKFLLWIKIYRPEKEYDLRILKRSLSSVQPIKIHFYSDYSEIDIFGTKYPIEIAHADNISLSRLNSLKHRLFKLKEISPLLHQDLLKKIDSLTT